MQIETQKVTGRDAKITNMQHKINGFLHIEKEIKGKYGFDL